jgi:hypothetical protein
MRDRLIWVMVAAWVGGGLLIDYWVPAGRLQAVLQLASLAVLAGTAFYGGRKGWFDPGKGRHQ